MKTVPFPALVGSYIFAFLCGSLTTLLVAYIIGKQGGFYLD